MITRSSPLAAALTLLLGCAAGSETLLPLTPVPAEPSPEAFAAKGEILVREKSAAFDDWRVVGPQVNMTRGSDGAWSGDLLGKSYVMKPTEGTLSGGGADLHFVQWGREVIVRGTLSGRKVNIRILPGEGIPTPAGIACRYDGNLVDCSKESSSVRQGIEFRGEAARVSAPPLPQFALALVAISGTSLGVGP